MKNKHSHEAGRLCGFNNIPMTEDEMREFFSGEEPPKFMPSSDMFSKKGARVINDASKPGVIPQADDDLLALIRKEFGADSIKPI